MLTRRGLLVTAGSAGLSALMPAAARALDQPTLTFLAVGDWGQPKRLAAASRVAEAMARTAADHSAAFVISTGDNFYGKGVSDAFDPQWRSSFEDVYAAPSLHCPWYVVLGNHDYQGNPDAEIAYSLISDRWRMPARYYAVRQKVTAGIVADFFYLDTNLFVGAGSPDDPQRQLDWLATVLRASQAPWKIVVGHHPVFSGGRHGNTKELVTALKPLLEQFGVRAYINGHDHDLQHIQVDGVHYFTTGAGAEARPTGQIPQTLFSASALGFLSVSLGAGQGTFQFLGDTNSLLYEAVVYA